MKQSRTKARKKSGRERVSSRRWRWLIGAAVCLAGVVVGWTEWNRVPAVPVPAIDLRDASPALVRRLNAARDAVVQHPGSADAWGELGMLLFAHQFERETNVCLEQAHRLNPGDCRWPHLLGVSFAVSDSGKAMEYFRRAIELNDGLGDARLRLGELLLQAERLDAAQVELDRAMASDPTDPRVHYNLARLWMMRGDLEKARRFADRAVEYAPETRSVRELLALILAKSGEREAAREQLAAAEESVENSLGWRDPIAGAVYAMRLDATSRWEQAEALLVAGRTNEAIGMLLEAMELDDRDPRIYISLARTLIQTNRISEAGDVLRRALDRHPESAELHFLLGSVEFLSGRWSNAEGSFLETVRLRPDHALGYYNLGHSRLKLGRSEEALQDFLTAARLKPDHVDSRINCIRVLWKQGNKAVAESHLRDLERLPGVEPSQVAKLRAELE